jgi:hypothetical protein
MPKRPEIVLTPELRDAIVAALARSLTSTWKKEHGQPMLTEAEAAKYICMSRAFLHAARFGRCAGPAYVRIGRAVRYRVSDLDAFLAERRVPPEKRR